MTNYPRLLTWLAHRWVDIVLIALAVAALVVTCAACMPGLEGE